MALEQQNYLYEVMARYNGGLLQGCHKIETVVIVDTATGAVVSESIGSAVAISQQEAAALIEVAVPIPVTGDGEE